MSQGKTDACILVGLERRQDWAAAALYDRLEGVVERALYRVLRQRGTDFEDLVQITFERIVRTLIERRFSAQCSLTTWASAIASNVAIDSVRKKVRERRIFAADPVDEVDHQWAARGSGADSLESRADAAEMLAVLAQMNAGQAEALFLHDAMGHDLAEVATIAGVTIAAAQSRLVRGRKEFMRRVHSGLPKGHDSDAGLSHAGTSETDDDGGQVP